MHHLLGFAVASTCAVLCGCASQPPPLETALQPDAVQAAQQLGASELGCSAITPEVLSGQAMEEGQRTGWRELPYRAEYTIGVSGCGKRTIYSVICEKQRATNCNAGPVVPSTTPPQLTDELRADALRAAQERGSKELGCTAATAAVTEQSTVQEPQTTGWYTVPYRAVYTISVAGCGKQTTYAVACNKQKKTCAAGSVLPAP